MLQAALVLVLHSVVLVFHSACNSTTKPLPPQISINLHFSVYSSILTGRTQGKNSSYCCYWLPNVILTLIT
mgnify:CR=1 FL=1